MWQKNPSEQPGLLIQKYLEEIGITERAFKALPDEDKRKLYCTYCAHTKSHALRRLKGDVPEMIFSATLSYCDERTKPRHLALLYYCFMVTKKEVRSVLWNDLVTRPYAKRFKNCHGLKEGLDDLSYVPFPYPYRTPLRSPSYGAHPIIHCPLERSHTLEEELSACCNAAGTPQSHESIRASIHRFILKIPTKHSTLTRMALLEKHFRIPAHLTLMRTTEYGLANQEGADTLIFLSKWKRGLKEQPHMLVQFFLNEIHMERDDFKALSHGEQLALLLKHYETHKANPLRPMKEGAPDMIQLTAFHHYKKMKEPTHFSLLYYCFMVTKKEKREALWNLIRGKRRV